MRITKKTLLVSSAAALVLLVVLAGLIVRSIDLAPYKSEIEAAALKSGLRLRIDGDANLSLIPLPGIEVNDVYIELGHKNRLAMEAFHIQFAILPLFEKEFRITKFLLKRPVAELTQVSMSFPKSGPSAAGNKQASTAFRVTAAKDASIVIRNGEIIFKEIGSPLYIEAKDVAINMWFRSSGNTNSEAIDLNELRGAGRLSAGVVRGKRAVAENVKARIKFERGGLKISNITGTLFGGNLSANIGLKDMASTLSGFLDLQLTDIDIARSTVSLENSRLTDGKLALGSRLKWKGTKLQTILRSLEGDINMKGENLRLRELDIDKALERIEKAKRLNLTDLGALFYLGPLGAVATKGYQYSELLKTRDSQPGTITYLISNWNIKDGRATVSDVALTTPNNRIALKGSVNFVESRFENLAFSVVDENGCGIMAQQLNGSFTKPKPSDVRSIRSIGRPFRDALREPIKKLTGTDCTVFYTGSLVHPDADKPPQKKSLISGTLQSIGISTGDD